MLIGFKVHFLAGAGHIEFEVVLHHERRVVVVAVEGRHHGGVMRKLVRNVVLHVVVVGQEDHFLLLLAVHTQQVALTSHPVLQVFVLASNPRPLGCNLGTLPFPALLDCCYLSPIDRLFAEKGEC